MDYPHRRYNSLTGDWVLVSPQRTQRPWRGKTEPLPGSTLPDYDPGCYLCPGNTRASGAQNPHYASTYAFTNDYAALIPQPAPFVEQENPLMKARPVRGTSRVLCFSPRHDLSLPRMTVKEIRQVIDMWADQLAELGLDYSWAQVFENRGEMMGSSMPHPHGQVWASDQLPNEPTKEDRRQREYYQEHGTVLLMDYLAQEIEVRERVVLENMYWAVVVPFWAVWPYETLLLPKTQVQYLQYLTAEQRVSLAEILKQLLTRYDNLFRAPFPYSMGWHPAPNNPGDHSHWQMHAHFYPPLLRSATIKKFLVGYEMMAEAQRDITPEQAAARLSELSDKHYLDRMPA